MKNPMQVALALVLSIVSIITFGSPVNARTIRLQATPSSLAFSAQSGGTPPAAQTLTINTVPKSARSFTLTSDQPWMTLSATSATRRLVLQVSVNPSGLVAGTYPGHIVVTSTGVTNSPLSVPVTLAVSSVPPRSVSPSISSQPGSQTVTQGQTATFSVTASGTAPLTYQWAKNGAVIGAATSASYTTPATVAADNGAQFSVAVSNSAGSATSASATLVVQGVPAALSCSVMSPGQGASLNGFRPFPDTNAWNQDISAAPLEPNSDAIIGFVGRSIGVHADFGAGLYAGSSIGIPYVVVGSAQNPVNINFTAYGDESDPGPMPIPLGAPIEGYPNPGNGDRHVLVLDNSKCWLYELYSAAPNSGGWDAGSAAVWDLLGSEQRPFTWTSADAGGLPIFPGLVRYDEVAAGHIDHALRFTLQSSRAAFVAPASHWASNSTNPLAAPMGMRVRLKSSFDISGFSQSNRVILAALKKYGMIMADNGSSMFLSGAPDDRWDNSDLHRLGGITASDFEVVQMGTVYTSANTPKGSAPNIAAFTASSQSVSAGTPVTLNWTVTGASYLIVAPEAGAVRNTSVTVNPAQSITYTLTATNAFGRTTATVSVTVY